MSRADRPKTASNSNANSPKKLPYISDNQGDVANYQKTEQKILALLSKQRSVNATSPASQPTQFHQFEKQFENKFYQNKKALQAIDDFINGRKAILGDQLKGEGIPAIMLTHAAFLTHNGMQHQCFITVSGIKHITTEEIETVSKKCLVSKDPENLKQLIQQKNMLLAIKNFWDSLNTAIKTLSEKSNLSFTLLPGRSRNFDALLHNIAIQSGHSALMPADHNPHKACAEKEAWNTAFKLHSMFGDNFQIIHEQAYRLLSNRQASYEIPPCNSCSYLQSIAQQIFGIAADVSPLRNRSTTTADNTPASTQKNKIAAQQADNDSDDYNSENNNYIAAPSDDDSEANNCAAMENATPRNNDGEDGKQGFAVAENTNTPPKQEQKVTPIKTTPAKGVNVPAELLAASISRGLNPNNSRSSENTALAYKQLFAPKLPDF